ncbi:MAG: response regulator transcription factor [Planctomycetota bacterium]|jgi:DNA-binding NarL/FixJ family response regulator
MAVRILLVDDHAMFRQGLCSLLKEQLDVEVVGEAEDGTTAIRLARELKPDLIVMDVNMPEMDGIDAARRILPEMPDVKLVALSTYLKRAFIIEMLKAGASGYILKEQAFDELVQAIKTVVSGETYLSTKAASVVVDGYVKSQDGRRASAQRALTEREREILKLLAEGKPSKEIALLLDISIQAVDASRRRIMQKLGVESLAELVKYAIREGLTSIDS